MSVFLGIDIGTSKVAAVLVDDTGKCLASHSIAHAASVPGLPQEYAEQDPGILLDTAAAAVSALPESLRGGVSAIGVTGQMHGVVPLDKNGAACGNLVTWQDRRCDQPFLAALERKSGHLLRTGYGCATLAWQAGHGGLPSGVCGSATIHDYLVSRLCDLRQPLCDPTDAASWGMFDLSSLSWDTAAVISTGLNPGLLPEIVSCSTQAGTLCAGEAARWGLAEGVPVAVAIGDNQASLAATLSDPEHELALTLGTGGQLSAVMPQGTEAAVLLPDATFEYRPYPGLRLLAVASCLCGGAAWKWLADSVQSMLADTGHDRMDENDLYALLNARGLESETGLTVRPHFLGERHDPSLRGAIDGIDLANCSLGSLARGLARGIIGNLQSMLPEPALDGRTRVMLSGNALRRNELLRVMAREVLGLETELVNGTEEAATGAALLAGRSMQGR